MAIQALNCDRNSFFYFFAFFIINRGQDIKITRIQTLTITITKRDEFNILSSQLLLKNRKTPIKGVTTNNINEGKNILIFQTSLFLKIRHKADSYPTAITAIKQ